jgi:hypothetical protein
MQWSSALFVQWSSMLFVALLIVGGISGCFHGGGRIFNRWCYLLLLETGVVLGDFNEWVSEDITWL